MKTLHFTVFLTLFAQLSVQAMEGQLVKSEHPAPVVEEKDRQAHKKARSNENSVLSKADLEVLLTETEMEFKGLLPRLSILNCRFFQSLIEQQIETIKEKNFMISCDPDDLFKCVLAQSDEPAHMKCFVNSSLLSSIKQNNIQYKLTDISQAQHDIREENLIACRTLTDMLQNVKSDATTPIPINAVDLDIIPLLLHILKHCFITKNGSYAINLPDLDLRSVTDDVNIIHLLRSASYLDIPDLVEYLVCKIATFLASKIDIKSRKDKKDFKTLGSFVQSCDAELPADLKRMIMQRMLLLRRDKFIRLLNNPSVYNLCNLSEGDTEVFISARNSVPSFVASSQLTSKDAQKSSNTIRFHTVNLDEKGLTCTDSTAMNLPSTSSITVDQQGKNIFFVKDDGLVYKKSLEDPMRQPLCVIPHLYEKRLHETFKLVPECNAFVAHTKYNYLIFDVDDNQLFLIPSPFDPRLPTRLRAKNETYFLLSMIGPFKCRKQDYLFDKVNHTYTDEKIRTPLMPLPEIMGDSGTGEFILGPETDGSFITNGVKWYDGLLQRDGGKYWPSSGHGCELPALKPIACTQDGLIAMTFVRHGGFCFYDMNNKKSKHIVWVEKTSPNMQIQTCFFSKNNSQFFVIYKPISNQRLLQVLVYNLFGNALTSLSLMHLTAFLHKKSIDLFDERLAKAAEQFIQIAPTRQFIDTNTIPPGKPITNDNVIVRWYGSSKKQEFKGS